MIQLSAAGKRYGHKLLFEDADWLITPESHVGLVGANGTGKSTVMAGWNHLTMARSLAPRGFPPDICPKTASPFLVAPSLPSACQCSTMSARWKRKWRP